MHAQLDALAGRTRQPQMLDAVAELLGVGNILARADARDALGVDLLELQHAEGVDARMVSLCAASMPSTSKVGSASA